LIDSQLLNRIQKHTREWGLIVEDTVETQTSLIAFGTRIVHVPGQSVLEDLRLREGAAVAGEYGHDQPVVLKVVKQPGDEWHSGEILKAFAGHGVVRVYEQAPGAVLMERLTPGNSLVSLAVSGRDEEATDILASVIREMSEVASIDLTKSASGSSVSSAELPEASPLESSVSSTVSPKGFATVQDWGKGFERYLTTGDEQVPRDLVEAGQQVYLDLMATQRQSRLLHGDLQHYNVLFDSSRGWLAIDPKGVGGEVEYEIGAALRNPIERPDLFLSRATIESRLKQFTDILNLNFERALRWTFAQAVLSAIWEIEDGYSVDAMNPSLRLADILRPMLKAGTADNVI